MDATAVFGMVVVAMLVGAAILLQRYREARAEDRLRREQLAFHAVSIKSRSGACAAAHHLKNKRFLAAEAPRLPLEACGAAECTCVYQHFDDRRVHLRRDVYMNKIYLRPAVDIERRRSAGRRKGDHAVLELAL